MGLFGQIHDKTSILRNRLKILTLTFIYRTDSYFQFALLKKINRAKI